jgi:hypothetical protein
MLHNVDHILYLGKIVNYLIKFKEYFTLTLRIAAIIVPAIRTSARRQYSLWHGWHTSQTGSAICTVHTVFVDAWLAFRN